LATAGGLGTSRARAAPTPFPSDAELDAVATSPVHEPAPDQAPEPQRPSPPASRVRLDARGPYVHLFGAAWVGRGLRFNNPYRLEYQLGDTGESLSLSATYLDLAAGVSLGDPDGWQHGVALHFSEALEGINQDVLTPCYQALRRVAPRWLVLARAGVPIVIRPDATGGVEVAAGGVWYVQAGLGLSAELVGSLFYGAGTWQRSVTTIPMLSLQVGVFGGYEVLP
jgi:hypothetical protein